MLQQGSSGDEVLKLQNMLTTLGFYTGNKTGNFGALTADAVTAYQKSKGLTADGIAGKRTLAAINADYSGNGSSSAGSTDGTTTPSAQVAGNVIYDNFYNWRRNYQNGEYCTVYDFSTGYSWKLRIMTKDAHMDAEPATAEDTAIMLKAFGGKTTWVPKAVWVTFSDGKTYIGLHPRRTALPAAPLQQQLQRPPVRAFPDLHRQSQEHRPVCHEPSGSHQRGLGGHPETQILICPSSGGLLT